MIHINYTGYILLQQEVNSLKFYLGKFKFAVLCKKANYFILQITVVLV